MNNPGERASAPREELDEIMRGVFDGAVDEQTIQQCVEYLFDPKPTGETFEAVAAGMHVLRQRYFASFDTEKPRYEPKESGVLTLLFAHAAGERTPSLRELPALSRGQIGSSVEAVKVFMDAMKCMQVKLGGRCVPDQKPDEEVSKPARSTRKAVARKSTGLNPARVQELPRPTTRRATRITGQGGNVPLAPKTGIDEYEPNLRRLYHDKKFTPGEIARMYDLPETDIRRVLGLPDEG